MLRGHGRGKKEHCQGRFSRGFIVFDIKNIRIPEKKSLSLSSFLILLPMVSSAYLNPVVLL
jgi:hypothetical protein